MKRFDLASMLIAVSLCLVGCDAGRTPSGHDANTTSSGGTIDTSKLFLRIPKDSPIRVVEIPRKEPDCPDPKPEKLGCNVTCKPCKIPECKDGAWVLKKFDWGPACEDPGEREETEPTPFVCVLLENMTFCPAECDTCVRSKI